MLFAEVVMRRIMGKYAEPIAGSVLAVFLVGVFVFGVYRDGGQRSSLLLNLASESVGIIFGGVVIAYVYERVQKRREYAVRMAGLAPLQRRADLIAADTVRALLYDFELLWSRNVSRAPSSRDEALSLYVQIQKTALRPLIADVAHAGLRDFTLKSVADLSQATNLAEATYLVDAVNAMLRACTRFEDYCAQWRQADPPDIPTNATNSVGIGIAITASSPGPGPEVKDYVKALRDRPKDEWIHRYLILLSDALRTTERLIKSVPSEAWMIDQVNPRSEARLLEVLALKEGTASTEGRTAAALELAKRYNLELGVHELRELISAHGTSGWVRRTILDGLVELCGTSEATGVLIELASSGHSPNAVLFASAALLSLDRPNEARIGYLRYLQIEDVKSPHLVAAVRQLPKLGLDDSATSALKGLSGKRELPARTKLIVANVLVESGDTQGAASAYLSVAEDENELARDRFSASHTLIEMTHPRAVAVSERILFSEQTPRHLWDDIIKDIAAAAGLNAARHVVRRLSKTRRLSAAEITRLNAVLPSDGSDEIYWG